MNRKSLEQFFTIYRSLVDNQIIINTWLEHCSHAVLVAEKARLPTPLEPHILYLKKEGHSLVMHGHNSLDFI